MAMVIGAAMWRCTVPLECNLQYLHLHALNVEYPSQENASLYTGVLKRTKGTVHSFALNKQMH